MDRTLSYQHGVTMTEIVVVLGMVGILSSIVAPSFVTMMQRFRSLSETSELTRAIQLARSESIRRGVAVTVCPSSDSSNCLGTNTWHKGWIVFTDPGMTKTVTTLLRIQQTFTNTDALTSDNNLSAVTFSADGFPIGLPGTGVITFTLKTVPENVSTTRCVVLNNSGRTITQVSGTGACR